MKPKTTTTMTTAPRCDYSTARIVKKQEPVTFLRPLLSTPDRQKYITRHTHKKKTVRTGTAFTLLLFVGSYGLAYELHTILYHNHDMELYVLYL